MLIKGNANSVFVNGAVSCFPDGNKRHTYWAFRRLREKEKLCEGMDWRLFFLIHTIGQERMSKATILTKPRPSLWCARKDFIWEAAAGGNETAK